MFTLNSCRQLLISVIAKDVADGCLKVAKYSCWTLGALCDTRFSRRSCVTRSVKQCHLQPAGRVLPKRHCSEMSVVPKRHCSEMSVVPKRHCSEMMIEPKSRGLQEKKEDTGPAGHSSFNIDVMVSLLRQENAVDICVIKIPEELNYSDYFIVVSGISPRHLSAMAHYAIKVHKYMKSECEPHAKLEGRDAEDWKCIDFGRMVLHLMLPETRELYELEKLWTLRSFDEQLRSLPAETLPEDFIYGLQEAK